MLRFINRFSPSLFPVPDAIEIVSPLGDMNSSEAKIMKEQSSLTRALIVPLNEKFFKNISSFYAMLIFKPYLIFTVF